MDAFPCFLVQPGMFVFDVLALRRNNAEPIIVLPWRTWGALLAKVRR